MSVFPRLATSRLQATILLAACLVAIATPVRSATFTVDTLADSGPGSLRQAILDANVDGVVDVIDFASGLVGTIELASPLPAVTESVIIQGPGAALLTVDANQQGRVLLLAGSDNDMFTLEGLTLTGGLVTDSSGGGGISVYSNQTLILDGIHIVANEVTGPGGDPGGGVYGSPGSKIVVRRSVVAHNESDTGGGVDGDAVDVLNSTIFANRARSEGAGLRAYGEIGVYESTITGNVSESETSATPGGGLVVRPTADLELFQSTITDNVAGQGPGIFLYAGGTISDIGATIVAGNRYNNGSEGNCNTDLGVTDRFNLSSDSSCGFTGASDLENTDPQLVGLAMNGGPTPTRILRKSSPAVDAGDNTLCVAVDQRNFARPIDGDGDSTPTCDIGAVEYQPGLDDQIHLDGFESGDLSAWLP